MTPQQREIITSKARYIAGIEGRRVGKTIGIIRNRKINRCLTECINYTYITPSYPQLEEEYDALAECEGLRPYIAKCRKQPPPYIRFNTGSRLSYRSFERPKNIRGRGEDEVSFDEIQDASESEFWAVIRPLISDRFGTLSVFGQLRGRNWVWRTFVLPGLATRYIQENGIPRSAADVADWGNNTIYDFHHSPVFTADEFDDTLRRLDTNHLEHAAWITPTTRGVRFASERGRRELDSAAADMPRALYEQEYLCIPTANAAGVFSPEHLLAARVGDAQSAPRPGRRYIIGLDLGRVKDHTALVILDTTDPVSSAVYEYRFPLGRSHEENARDVAAMAARWNQATVMIDTTGGATGGHANADEYAGVYLRHMPHARRVTWNRITKREMIEGAVIQLEQHRVRIPTALRLLHAELAQYTYTARRDNSVDYHAPKGEHDDIVAAFVMALYGHKRGFNRSGDLSGLSALLPG